jgi:GDPmannose 4,6-dehydratase
VTGVPVALVTGATGQDGSYLCELLAAEGTEVHALARPGSLDVDDAGRELLRASVADLVWHEADLADPVALAAVIADVAPDEVYNFAGVSSVAQSWQDPVTTGTVTGVAVASLLHAAWRLQEDSGRPVRVVQASSAEIFGDAPAPQTEATPIRPRSPYGAAKAYAHHMVDVFRARDLHAATVILYNHESPRRPTTFVTRKITHGVARIAAGLDRTLTLGSLDVTRDWGWAPDYVAAAVAAIRHERADDFVVATGVPHTVADFVRVAFAEVGIDDWQAHVTTDPAFVRPADAAVQLGDAGKAARELGWTPTVTFDGVVAAMVAHDVELLRAET